MRDSVLIAKNKISIEDEYHFILECSRYNDLRRKYIKQYYRRIPSAYKLVTLLSVRNVKELNNSGKYLCLAKKLRNVNLSLLMSYIYNHMYLFQTMTKCITLRDTCSFIHMFVFIYLYLHLIYNVCELCSWCY